MGVHRRRPTIVRIYYGGDQVRPWQLLPSGSLSRGQFNFEDGGGSVAKVERGNGAEEALDAERQIPAEESRDEDDGAE